MKNLISSGSGGPTMNGVMNYHVGEAVPWETRAYYPPNCLPRDGQLVNRADWPELWAWAQKTSPITDAVWLADVTKRGSYSTGDGSTTFRLPDWNGIQSGSIPGVFFRGGTGAADMIMALNAAPNITGSLSIVGNGSVNSHLSTDWGEGALFTKANNAGGSKQDAYTTANNANLYQGGIGIDASRSNSSYGRNNTGEVVPNKVSGVWLVRASGGFVAANTSWSVINSLTSAPGVSTTTYGGDVNSTLKVGTADYGKAGLRAVVNSDASGVKTVGAQVVVTDSTGSTSTQKVINLGTVNGLTGGSISGTYLGLAGSSTGGFVGLEINNTASDPAGCYYNAVMNGYVRGGIEITNDRDGKSGYALRLLFSRNNSVTTDHRELGLSINSNGTTWMVSQPTYGSDERLKKEVEDIGSTRDALRTLRTSRYVMDGRRQIGLIAQDVQKYWPELIDNFEKVTYSESGEKTEGTYLSLNYTGMIAPTIKAVNENSDTIDKLMDIVKEAIATIAGVTTDESAKVALEALAERIPAPDTQ
ncbi:TPA: tail fiber domain-containing protein [Kluyvera ascorbata F0526]|nr:tail fiber domain-containing protein [Kluyvera ascorbata F0526]